ncbi:hypothetical protein MMC24_006946 [Lignoscripta atroalba]|nr:hypothetical protein [Lignoscripta atroalba]
MRQQKEMNDAFLPGDDSDDADDDLSVDHAAAVASVASVACVSPVFPVADKEDKLAVEDVSERAPYSENDEDDDISEGDIMKNLKYYQRGVKKGSGKKAKMVGGCKHAKLKTVPHGKGCSSCIEAYEAEHA